MAQTILIVEDHKALRASLRDWLEAAVPGSRVLEACCGEEAVNLAAVHRPDITLMDVQLPGMSGIEATRRIKTALPATKVIMVSIHEAPEYQAAATQAGASAYVFKRRMHAELMPVIAGILAQTTTGREQVIG